jgi:hypothetical protein
MNYRLAGHWFGLLLFFCAGTFFLSFFIAWLWPAAFPRRPVPAAAPALASLGLALICYLKFGVLAATRARRHQPPAGRP